MNDLIALLKSGEPPPARLRDKLSVFYRLAWDLSSLSRCRRLRVGCVVVQPDLSEVLAIGYNGPPAGEDNDACRAASPVDRPAACGCVHADASALVKLRSRDRGLLMVLTHSPCEHCAGLVLNCGRVGAVVHGEDYRDTAGVELLRRLGIAVARASDLGLTK